MLNFLKFFFLGKGNVNENQIAEEEAGLLQLMHDEFYNKIKHIDPDVEIEMISGDEGKCIDRVVARYLGVPIHFISAKLDEYRIFSESIRPWIPSVIRNMVDICKINSLFQIPFGIFEEEDQSIRRIFSETAKTMAISYMGHMWLVHFSKQLDFLETTRCTSIAGSHFDMLFDFEDGLVLEDPKDVNLARFLNSEKFLSHLYEHVGVTKSIDDIKKMALEFSDFKDFFFEEHKLTEEYYGNDFNTAISDACKIKLNMDPTKGFLTIRKLHGSGWNSIVYYFQFVYEDVKVIQKGTTDIFQALAWLKHYKYRSFSVKSDVPVKGVYIDGKFWLISDLSCETAVVATTQQPFVFVERPMEVYRTSRLDLLKEREEEPLFVEYTKDELEEIALRAHLKAERKRKEIRINIENIVTQVFTLNNNIIEVDQKVDYIYKKLKEQGIVSTNEIVYVQNLEQINTLHPISFCLFEKQQIELKSLQLRELAKGRILIFLDSKNLWKYFELGSKYHVFNQFKLLNLLFDEVDVSPIMEHYLLKYAFPKIKNVKHTGFRIRLHIILSTSFELDLFCFHKDQVLINKKVRTIEESWKLLNSTESLKFKKEYVVSLFKWCFGNVVC